MVGLGFPKKRLNLAPLFGYALIVYRYMEHILPSYVLKKVFFVDALWYTLPCAIVTNFLLEQFTGLDFCELVFCFWPIICRYLHLSNNLL